jgi:hypothetical protein
MNATNPIFKALKAAYAELSSPDAIQWYQDTAYQTYLVVGTLATLAVCLVEDWLLEPQETGLEAPSDEYDLVDLLLPSSPIAGLLMPAKERPSAPCRIKGQPIIVPPSFTPMPTVAVKNIKPTIEYSGGAATSCQRYLFYRR